MGVDEQQDAKKYVWIAKAIIKANLYPNEMSTKMWRIVNCYRELSGDSEVLEAEIMDVFNKEKAKLNYQRI